MAKPPDTPSTRRWSRVVAAIAAALLLLACGLSLWAWTQRYALVERQLVAALEERGFQAELRVHSASRTGADIRDIRLQHKGQPLASAERLQLQYQWRDLLDGRVERVDLSGLDIALAVDARGRITNSWMPEGTGGAAGFPARGVGVRSGTVRVSSPFGAVAVTGDADIASPRAFDFRGRVQPSVLSWQGTEVQLSGPADLARNGDTLIARLPDTRLTLVHPAAELRDTRAALSGRMDLASRVVGGRVELSGGAFQLSAGVAGGVETLVLDGAYAPDTGFQATLEPRLRGVGIVDKARRAQLAQTLSLSGALRDVPVAQTFAPQIGSALDTLLGGSDIGGRLRASLADDGRTLTLLAPLALRSGATELRLDPADDAPFYARAPGAPSYTVSAVARLSEPVPLTLSPLSVSVRSSDGFRVDGVESASGRLQTRGDWRGRSAAGVAARLGPLGVTFDYANPGDTPARVVLRGAADYSGEIPGGTVTDLEAGGRMVATLRPDRPAVNFFPTGPVRFARLDTTSEWSLADFTGTLRAEGPIYQRLADGTARVEARLAEAEFRALRDPDSIGGAAELSLRLSDAAACGSVRSAVQDWTVAFGPATLRSATFPVAGTDLSLPSGTLDVTLSRDARTRFALSAPGSTLVTPGYRVVGMAVDASGTAERYTLAFEGGEVRLATAEGGVPPPVMPASGVLRFADGVFTGEARTHLPRAADQPFDVSYRIQDGRGTAQVRIRDLVFAPRRLQPQDLVPALRGKVARVEGPIDADLSFRFGGDQPPIGTGTLELKGLSLGTAPGPVSGLSGTVALTSLFPVVTAPGQTLRVELFDPGVPLRDGEFTYALVEGGVAVSRAVWPLGRGQASIDPFTWTYGADENRVTFRVSGVEVEEILRGVGNDRIRATGVIQGAVPVVVRGIDVLVEGGRLEVADGGTIRYKVREGLAERVPNRFAADALKALENFRYDALYAELNGPLGGEVKLGMSFTGTNEDVLYGVPFAFDVSVEGELFNIARSFNTNATIKRSVGSAFRAAD